MTVVDDDGVAETPFPRLTFITDRKRGRYLMGSKGEVAPQRGQYVRSTKYNIRNEVIWVCVCVKPFLQSRALNAQICR